MKKLTRILAVLSTTVALASVTADAAAATIKISCEKRANRSRVSVDGSDLRPGAYRGRIISGTNRRTSDVKFTVGDEVEFDFDSATNEVGATRIAAGFIVGGQVTGKIIDAQGRTVISDTEQCRTR